MSLRVMVARLDVVAVRVSPPPEQAAMRALKGEWVFVRAWSPDRLVGLGEATHGGDDEALARYVQERIGPRLAGSHLSTDAGETPDDRLAQWHAECGDRVIASAVSGVEQALWDLLARAGDVPLHQALARVGAPGESKVAAPAAGRVAGITLYATLNRGIFDRSPGGFASAARQAVAQGFRAVKCAPFDGVVHGGAQDTAERAARLDEALARVSAVRAAIGPDVELMLDCHGRLTEREGVAVAHRLEPYRLRWLEEPVPFEPDPAPLARVRREAGIPIAAGELMFGVERFRPLLEAGAVDVIMPDVKHCGGLQQAQRIAALAAEHNVLVAPHNPSGPISTLSSAHLCAALPNAPLLEYAWGEVPWRAALTNPAETIENGRLRLPAGPGLGAALDAGLLREHHFDLGA